MIVKSFGGHSFSPDYAATLQGNSTRGIPAAKANMIPRRGRWPLFGSLDRAGREIYLGVSIESLDTSGSLYGQLCQWLDPEDETVKKLSITDDDGSNERYMEVTCEGMVQQEQGIKQIFTVTLAVNDDIRWRAETQTSGSFVITASGTSGSITNTGTEIAYPTFRFTPATKTGGFTYRAWVPILWVSANPATKYSLVATMDTSGSHIQVDGDDLRVYSDGIEIDRWLDAINTAATKIWFNLDFARGRTFTLKTYIADAGNISQIDASEDIASFPNAGIILIGTESFVYTSKDNNRKMFLGITRGTKGTSLAAHNAGVTCYWIQHDVYIMYGNAALTVPVVNDDYKPAFELDHSTNASWVYEIFGDYNGKRGGSWQKNSSLFVLQPIDQWSYLYGGAYSANHRALASPFTVMGMWLGAEKGTYLEWALYNPCGITNAVWSNGEGRRNGSGSPSWQASTAYWPRVQTAYWWQVQYDIPTPAVLYAWEAWSYSGAAFAVSDKIGLMLFNHPEDVEVGDVTVTLNAAEIPTVTVYAEQSSYSMETTLTNVTTDDAFSIAFEILAGQTLEINTRDKTVIYLKDNSSQFQAIAVSSVRQDWFPLNPGLNVIRLDDTGIASVVLAYTFVRRWY